MHRIVAVEALQPYRVRVSFADGVQGEISLADLVGEGVFCAWRDARVFSQVSIDPETHTLTWPGGIDLCPGTLYEDVLALPAA